MLPPLTVQDESARQILNGGASTASKKGIMDEKSELLKSIEAQTVKIKELCEALEDIEKRIKDLIELGKK